MDSFPLLSTIAYLPLLGAVVIFFLPRLTLDQTRRIAVGAAALSFIASLFLLPGFDRNAEFQFTENVEWLPSLGISYHLAVDGIAVVLILLTTLLSLIAIGWSWDTVRTRHREYYIAILILETGMLGVFMALDLFIFYVFWEVMLIPMALLIGIWGSGNRVYAAMKFFLYTLFGSLLMLAGIVATYQAYFDETGVRTLNILELQNGHYGTEFQRWAFAAFFIAFAVKVPMFPLHTWLPDAHVEAPTAASVILAAIMLKMGGYGMLRFNLPLFEEGSDWWSTTVIVLSIIAILYGALVSLVQTDMKKLIAYSSISHMGFVTLGIFVFNLQGLEGAMLVMLAHGFNTGALFLLIGVIYERAHTREISAFSGLASRMPVYAAYFTLFMFASIGLPGLSGFIGEFLVALGTWNYNRWAAVFTFMVVIFSAWYMMWLYQRVIFGRAPNEAPDPHDNALTPLEKKILADQAAQGAGGAHAPLPVSGGAHGNEEPSRLARSDDSEVGSTTGQTPEGGYHEAHVLSHEEPGQGGVYGVATGVPYPDQTGLAGLWQHWPDLTLKEVLTIAPLAVLTLVVGIYPAPIFDIIEPSLERILSTIP